VTTVGQANWHPTGEVLEEYAFRRLSEADADSVEEHLLICTDCQHALAEIDQYILLMKHVTPAFDRRAHRQPRPRRQQMLSFAFGAAALGLAACLTIAMRSPALPLLPESVHLKALRGAEADGSLAHRFHPLGLEIDTTGLEEAPRYRADIVDIGGRMEWTGETSGFGDSRSVQLPQGLRAGQHWVRLFAHGRLLREFGLRVD
jgi:hypothetical protein